jgi:dCMP deaminase
MTRQTKWDLRFLKLAYDWSRYSKDPSTKTGAVVVRDHDLSVAALGFNGFPPGVEDTLERYADRELKYKMVIHCEINAMDSVPEPLRGYTLYTWPFMSCPRCAVQVIKRGIKRCVAPEISDELNQRWGNDIEVSKLMYSEAGVELCIYTWDEIEAAILPRYTRETY